MIERDLNYLKGNFGANWVSEEWLVYEKASHLDPKKYPPLTDRIFPRHYAPIIYFDNVKNDVMVSLMRYGANPKKGISNTKKYTTFNARRDNLESSFWSEAYRTHHGFVVLKAFYEWVAVRDLLRTGRVSLREIEDEFALQKERRHQKILSQEKKYRPTPTELKNAVDRQIIIQFHPEDHESLIVPVIFSLGTNENIQNDRGFAIITDEPPHEIKVAGHDRCPVVLESSSIKQWLEFKNKTHSELNELLALKKRVTFSHRLDRAV